ncbi:MAG: RluA family pseudouridine synthase [Eubacterium sp.]|nr:RluA family pseudouridine synthase [Eubacterium sp.]
MREIKIIREDSGQRFDKFLKKYLKEAPGSFIYKMLRKKNIKLNGKKAEGREMLCEGDVVALFLSEQTIQNFRGTNKETFVSYPSEGLSIVYENKNFIFVNKSAGMLSQKAKKEDVSLVEYLLGYLQKKGEWKPGDTFTPGICNRLDRNTSGLVMAGKNLAAVQKLSDLLKTRGLDKYYLTIVEGVMEDRQKLRGFLQKNEKKNQVAIYREAGTGRVPVETHYEPLCNNGIYTLLKVKLVTGKTHQIRAHLAGTGHPVLGDLKYGAKPYKGQRQQLLHAWKMIFPEIVNYPELSGRCFTAALPENFQRMIKELFDNYKIMEV